MPEPGSAPPYPSRDDVEAIVATADPVLRNLRITAGYGRLARAFAVRLPGGANWCAFGTWASRQAGCTIRKEDVGRAVARHLRARLAGRPRLREADRVLGLTGERLAWLAGELSQGLPGIDRASSALTRGNGQIFAEIGRAFSRYLDDGPARFGDGLRPGPLPDGQDLLRDGFASYAEAARQADPAVRAQLILLANVLIALHEQTIVQPELREAMDAALLDVADTRRRILARLDEIAAAGPLGAVQTGAGRRLVNALADDIADELRAVTRLVLTDLILSLELADGRRVRLGDDVPGPFPPSLAAVTHPSLVAQLSTLGALTRGTGGSATCDWSRLADRMQFLAVFFRAFQEDATLLAPPFDAAQDAAIAAGRVPEQL